MEKELGRLAALSASQPFPLADFSKVPSPARFKGFIGKRDSRETFSSDVSDEQAELFRLELADFQSDEERISKILLKNPGIVPLAELVKISPKNLSRMGRLDFLAALEKQSSWLQALMQSAIIAVAGEEETQSVNMYEGVDESEREDISTTLKLAPMTAQGRIDVARTLTQELPQTCAALAAGDISSAHANVIAREGASAIKAGLDGEQIRELEFKALSFAEFHTPSQVTRKIRGLVARMSPQTFEEKVEAATHDRRVYMKPEEDGMATIVAFLPAPDAQTIMLAINRLARKEREVIRNSVFASNTGSASSNAGSASENANQSNYSDLGDHSHEMDMGNLRADALTKIATAFLATNEETLPEHRRPVTLNLTMDLPTMLGLANNPAQLSGYGAIPASIARKLAADGKWKRFITDPITGNLLDYGRESYLPPQHLVDFLMARDRICRFPGCSQPGHRSDIDHAKPWDDNGQTSAENLGLLCRRHHRMKTHDGWKLVSFADGSCEWTSPDNKKHFVPARPIDEVA